MPRFFLLSLPYTSISYNVSEANGNAKNWPSSSSKPGFHTGHTTDVINHGIVWVGKSFKIESHSYPSTAKAKLKL